MTRNRGDRLGHRFGVRKRPDGDPLRARGLALPATARSRGPGVDIEHAELDRTADARARHLAEPARRRRRERLVVVTNRDALVDDRQYGTRQLTELKAPLMQPPFGVLVEAGTTRPQRRDQMRAQLRWRRWSGR